MTSLRIMEAITEKKQDLATLAGEVRIYPQLLQNVRVNNKAETRSDEAVVSVIAEVERELADNGRVLVRESGTEPVIRVMVEADTDELCKQSVDKIVNVMKESEVHHCSLLYGIWVRRARLPNLQPSLRLHIF